MKTRLRLPVKFPQVPPLSSATFQLFIKNDQNHLYISLVSALAVVGRCRSAEVKGHGEGGREGTRVSFRRCWEFVDVQKTHANLGRVLRSVRTEPRAKLNGLAMRGLQTLIRLVGWSAEPAVFRQIATAHVPLRTGGIRRVTQTCCISSAAPGTRIPTPGWSGVPVRGKSSKQSKKVSKKKMGVSEEEDEDDEDSDPEASDEEEDLQDDPNLPRNYKDQERSVPSLRYDLVIRAGLDMPRNKIDDAFYQNRLRLNGQRLIKKSKTVSVGDTLDLLLEDNEQAGTVTVMRIIFKAVTGETDTAKYKVLLRRWKHLTLPRAEPGRS
ncbi:hypothetical protein GN956_G18945 [Arapaima gigas]